MNTKRLVLCAGAVALGLGIVAGTGANRLWAAPVNPAAFKEAFDAAKKDADVVADVRVVAVVCSEVAAGEGDNPTTVTLQVVLLVEKSEKGTFKKNEVVTVTHKVALPTGPGPRAYGYMAATRKFPFQPGVKGSVALQWKKDDRAYTALAGWVPDPNGAEIPKEVGKVAVAAEEVKSK
jgi:hypothetical protein